MISINSPAKINLILKITGKRLDGFHEIETIMQEIDLSDTLTFAPNKNNQFSLTMEGIKIPGELKDNLIIKTANLFFKNLSGSNINKGVDVHLIKNIPCGSGMGGGSSNVVATLKGLNQLYEFPFSFKQLSEMAAQLGSDTVFFLYGGRCHCSGRGEIIRQFDNKEKTNVVLYVPDIVVSTAQVFNKFELSATIADKNNYQFNDLETAAFKVAPELSEIKKKLAELTGTIWFMTGSGSTFFSLSDTKDFNSLKKIQAKLPGKLIPTLFQYSGTYVPNH